MRWLGLAEWIGFQGVWFACALGASQGRNWPGVAAAVVFLLLVLMARRWPKAEMAAIVGSGVLGAAAESALATTGLVVYAAAGPGALIAPAWIVALWFAFGGTLAALEALLGPRAGLKAGLLGLVAGPLSYLAGARLGALAFPGDAMPALAATGLLWAVALPLLLSLRRSFSS